MSKYAKYGLFAAFGLTLLMVGLWQATGGDYYTKFEIVEQVEKEVAADDPLAAAGFYDGGTTTETVRRDAFRLGLLPTPAGIIDKHLFSVVSVSVPSWMLALLLLWISRRQRRLQLRAAEIH